MVRRKQIFNTTVQLVLNGPKSIINGPLTTVASLNHTWYELFNGELGLQIIPKSGVFVCTMNYTPSDPKEGQGWRSELSELIGEFVTKFERNRKQVSVRICHPSDIDLYNQNNNAFRNGPDAPPILSPSANPRPTPPPTPESVSSASSSSSSRAPPPPPSFNFIKPAPPGPSTSRLPPSSFRTPSLSIPTQGSNPPKRPSPPIVPASYQKPRYHSANGIPHSADATRTQQQVYGTRQKRHHEENLASTSSKNPGAPPVNGGSKRPKSSAPPASARVTRTSSRVGLTDTGPQIQDVFSVKQEVASVVVTPEWDDEPGWDEPEDTRARNVPQNGGNGRRDEFDSDSDNSEDLEDAMSLMTAATAEENELIRQGIQVDDVRTGVLAQVPRFSNAFMLRVRNEMRKLKRQKLWERNVVRSPLCCYLLQELFKEAN